MWWIFFSCFFVILYCFGNLLESLAIGLYVKLTGSVKWGDMVLFRSHTNLMRVTRVGFTTIIIANKRMAQEIPWKTFRKEAHIRRQ